MKRKIYTTLLGGIILTIVLASCRGSEKTQIRVAAAANMQVCMSELLDSFYRHTHIRTELLTGSSGSLLNLILQGAPYNVFVSADTHYSNQLQHSGRGLGETVPYARGRLILWSFDKMVHPDSFLSHPEQLRHLAIANPAIAPYGAAARTYLINRGIWHSLQGKIVFGEHIGQVNQFIRSGAADVGITAVSAVAADKDTHSRNWCYADTTLYNPILQGAIAIDQPTGRRESALLLSYLVSEPAKRILRKHGYLSP